MQAEQVPILDHFQILHAHARDDALTFHPETHSYYINGTKTHGSVTSLIHRFVHPFESDAIIDKMICSENWPRPDYLKSYIHPQDFADLSMCPEAAELVSLLGVRGSSSHEICRLAQSLKRRHPALKSLVNAIAMSPSQIVKKWTLQKEEAALLGTRMHACLECILNGGDCPETAEVQLFLKFLHGLEGKIFRTEWKIWGGEECIAGAIDFVSQKQDGTLVLYDWKRSKALWQKEASSITYASSSLSCAGCAAMALLTAAEFVQVFAGKVLWGHCVRNVCGGLSSRHLADRLCRQGSRHAD